MNGDILIVYYSLLPVTANAKIEAWTEQIKKEGF